MHTQLQTQRDDLRNANIMLSDLKTRNQMIDASIKEIDGSNDKSVWASCGKAFIKEDTGAYKTKLRDEKDTNEGLISDVEKKKNYLETSLNTTLDNMNRLLDRIEQLQKQ